MNTTTPNVLLLLTDDQRHDTIGALGNRAVRTPAMDQLVLQGTTFTNAYIPGGTSAAVCMPSRAMLHTGRSLFHLENSGESIPADHRLLGETLAGAGYDCHGIGKWHNGTESFSRSFTGGAEIFFGGMDDHWNVPACHYDPSGTYPHRAPIVRTPLTSCEVEYRLCDHLTPGRHSSDLFADAAVSYINQQSGERPFFLSVAFMAPHDPRTMPREFREMYPDAQIDLPANFLPEHPFDTGRLTVRDELLAPFPRTPDNTRGQIADYYAMITHLDHAIARVLRALDVKGLRESTIVILAGDNGLAVGQHGLMGKQCCYEHSVHVPLIISGPNTPRNERRRQPVYLFDLYPSLCEMLELSVPATCDGRSLAPYVADPNTPGRPEVFFAYENFQRALLSDRYKLIEYLVDGTRTTQLFDLRNDPWEMNDLSQDASHEATVAALRERLAQTRSEWEDPLPDALE
jgi:arylsulfatase A-like enzyme